MWNWRHTDIHWNPAHRSSTEAASGTFSAGASSIESMSNRSVAKSTLGGVTVSTTSLTSSAEGAGASAFCITFWVEKC